MKPIDPYTASIFDSTDCDRDKYRTRKLPEGLDLRSAYKLLKEIPFWSLYKTGKKFKSNPSQAKEEYLKVVLEDKNRLEKLALDRRSGAHTGTLEDFSMELCDAIRVSIQEECGAISGIVTGYKKFDEKRRDEKLSKEIREEYEALCGGYVGDELMETNIEMYHLAKTLPLEVWNQYDHESMKSLAIRIETNLAEMGKSSTNNSNIDLPIEFLESWKLFMHKFGYDGQDQLFMSCPRYDDSPEFLLGKMRMNALGEVKDPYITQQERVAKRRAVQTNHEEDAAKLNKLFHPFALSKIKKRNEYLEHVMWMRNSPKMRLANVIGIIRAELLRIQDKFIDSGRLEEKNDIFHLTIDEIDKALIDNDQQQEEQLQLMDIVRPRKVVYERALRATICPLLVDSRCRILQPDPPTFKDGEEPPEGTLIGSAVAPGIAIGTVRIIDHPNEKFENGEVLCATVTGPAWTPLFASASAVVLQIGGVLQHGAVSSFILHTHTHTHKCHNRL